MSNIEDLMHVAISDECTNHVISVQRVIGDILCVPQSAWCGRAEWGNIGSGVSGEWECEYRWIEAVSDWIYVSFCGGYILSDFLCESLPNWNSVKQRVKESILNLRVACAKCQYSMMCVDQHDIGCLGGCFEMMAGEDWAWRAGNDYDCFFVTWCGQQCVQCTVLGVCLVCCLAEVVLNCPFIIYT